MADIILLLPDYVANQIAAGEVIQRPASVVKELMENAIDAQATQIQLLINGAGKTMIQVIDNGMGMSPNDVRLAFERHATSKIKSADDLFSITSKGFRGEALASIAAIAQLEVHTKRAEDEMATCLKISGSKAEDQEVAVAPTGTSIAVKNLFYNVPARRNFLKSDKVELRHIIDEFHRVALTHPEVKFTFTQNGSELFDLPAVNFRKRIANIFGNKIEEKLIPVEEMTTVAGIEGFIVKPEFAKKSRGQQFFFVNKRFIKSSFLHYAVNSAFQGLLSEQFHPGYFIYMQIDPKTIDINIHPTKTEIKFEEERNLFAIIKSMVRHSLGMFQSVSVLDFERDPSLDTPYNFQQKSPSNMPLIEVDSSFNPFKDSEKGIPKASKSNWESLYSGLEMPNDRNAYHELKLSIKQAPKVFQLLRKFIVTTTRSGLLVIDQQRAHQRVLYEKFLTSITKRDMVSQQLIFPKEVELTQLQITLFGELEANLNAMGFVVKQKNNHLQITGIPAICDDKQLGELFEDIFSPPDEQEQVVNFSQADYMAKILSKSLSIKGNLTLSIEEQQALVDDLFACKDTLTCPFNRKIFITLDKEELEKKLD